MEEIKTFERLFEIQDAEYHSACILDLFFLRASHKIIDGYALVIGAECSQHLKLYFLRNETYNKLTEGEKDYLERHYGIEQRKD